MARSESEKALDAIKVSDKDLQIRTWPFLQNAIDARKRKVRNTRILRDYLAAIDKEGEIKKLSEIWALAPGKIRSIIEDMREEGAAVPEMASEVEALRQIKRVEILNDGQALRDELTAQIARLEELRCGGDEWADVEVIEDTGGKFAGTKTKRLPINQGIKELKEQIVLSHKKEADALEMYMAKPKQEFQHNINTFTDEEIEAGLRQAGYEKKRIENAGQIQGETESEES